MPNAMDAIGALQYAKDNFDSSDMVKQQKSVKIASKLGLGLNELKQVRWAYDNPNSDESFRIKDSAMSRIADMFTPSDNPSIESTKGGPLKWYERMGIQNLIDENPDLQIKYLEKKGYQARLNGDKVEVRKPGTLDFEPIDPKNNDYLIQDFTDIMWPTIQGITEGVVSGAKAFGAGLGGPIGLAAATGVGAALSAAGETARQGVGIATGMRPKLDYPLIGEQALWGAGGNLLLKGAGQGLSKISQARKAAGAAKAKLRPEAVEISEAVSDIGATATPGMLSANKQVRQTEDQLMRSRSNWFPTTRKLQKKGEAIREAVDQTATDIIENAAQRQLGVPASEIENASESVVKTLYDRGESTMKELVEIAGGDLGKMPAEVGGEVRESIVKKLGGKLKKSTDLYKEISTALKDKDLVPDSRPIINAIRRMKQAGNDPHNAMLDEWIDRASKIQTMDQLNGFKTRLMNELPSMEKSVRGAGRQVIKKATELVDTTFAKKILSKIKEFEVNPNKVTKSEIDYYEQLSDKLYNAKKLYREVNEQVDSILKRPGAQILRKTADEKIKDVSKLGFEDAYKKIASSNDMEKAEYLIKKFPEEMRKLRINRLSELYNEALLNSKDANEVVLNYFKKASDSEKKALLGPNAENIIKNASAGYSGILNEIKKTEKIAEILKKAYSSSTNKQVRNQAFGDAIAQSLRSLSPSEKLMIFGTKDTKKLDSLIKVFKYKLDLANPPETAEGLKSLKSYLGQIWNEANLVRKYKSEVINPAKMGSKTGKAAKALLTPTSFGAFETSRNILIPRSNREDNNKKKPILPNE